MRFACALSLLGINGAQAYVLSSRSKFHRSTLLSASQPNADSAYTTDAANIHELSRRELLWAAALAVTTSAVAPALAAESPPRSVRPLVYEVKATDPPQMQPLTPRGERRIIAECSQMPAVVLGTHSNSEDATLTARLLKKFAENTGSRGMVVALASVVASAEAQRALDAFVNRNEPNAAVAETALKNNLELCGMSSADSTTAFETAVLPLCKVARELGGMRVAAVGVSDSVPTVVQTKGYEGLGTRYADYVPDPKGFADAVAEPGFKRFISYYSNYATRRVNNKT